MGKDRVGWMYMDLALRAAKEYESSHPPLPIDTESVRQVENVVNRTLWGAYNMASYVESPHAERQNKLTVEGRPQYP